MGRFIGVAEGSHRRGQEGEDGQADGKLPALSPAPQY